MDAGGNLYGTTLLGGSLVLSFHFRVKALGWGFLTLLFWRGQKTMRFVVLVDIRTDNSHSSAPLDAVTNRRHRRNPGLNCLRSALMLIGQWLSSTWAITVLQTVAETGSLICFRSISANGRC
jgi:hypothetical protein